MGSARPFPSEPEDPQGEEGVAARASRHENAETLILLHSSHIFIQSSVTREGVSRGTRGGDTPPAPPRRGRHKWGCRSTEADPGVEGCRQPQSTIKYGSRHPTKSSSDRKTLKRLVFGR